MKLTLKLALLLGTCYQFPGTRREDDHRNFPPCRLAKASRAGWSRSASLSASYGEPNSGQLSLRKAPRRPRSNNSRSSSQTKSSALD
ncbi:MAG TPA: hypothetical protein PLO61_10205 [Fimbriimonadaceae bacterium]|nr:hypothetical protein [Fimbriimonadaceae bacterium]